MESQHSGAFARGLRAHGVKLLVIGDLTEEWYLYSIAHPIQSQSDVIINTERYFKKAFVEKMLGLYGGLGGDSSVEGLERRYGEVMSMAQVHLPVRLLVRDLKRAGFPILRYEIGWTPEEKRPAGRDSLFAVGVPKLTS